MTTTGARIFFDTNIVLRLLNQTLSQHDEVTLLVERVKDHYAEIWISRQVMREYLVQVTRTGFLDEPLSISTIKTHIATMVETFTIADETEAVTDMLLDLLATYPTGGKQIHDANLVATMLVNQIDTLLTLNVSDLQRFADRIRVLSLDYLQPNDTNKDEP